MTVPVEELEKLTRNKKDKLGLNTLSLTHGCIIDDLTFFFFIYFFFFCGGE